MVSEGIIMLKEFFHHLFNPHCVECREEKKCLNCETLREILETEKYEKKRILDRLLGTETSKEDTEQISIEPIKPRFTTWRARQQMLEAEDKAVAEMMRTKERTEAEDISKLEGKLGVG
jgi:hypothetical protein